MNERVDGDALLARLAEWWQNPPVGRYSMSRPQRIAGGEFDQMSPGGVSNPYWEIIRQLPLDELSASFSFGPRRPEPSGLFSAAGGGFSYLADRHALCATYAWAIPAPGAIAWIAKRARGRGIVEPGAGLGYWAWQLRQAGVDVAAYEPQHPADNTLVAGEPWFPVLQGDHDAVKHHPDRSLLLCWPSNSEPWGAWALSCYQGDQLFYIGEGEGGCCADDEFFRLLNEEWEEAGDCGTHISWWGVHDYLTEYRRKG